MKTKIKNIASVQTGFFMQNEGRGDVNYLQVKHFDDSGHLIDPPDPELKTNKLKDRHLLKEGDILFAAKGLRNFAGIVQKQDLPAVASTSFFIIHIKSKEILPGYLAWFLNLSKTLNYLKNKSSGTGIPSIRKRALEELELSIPSIEKQRLILNITATQKRQEAMMNKIILLNKQKTQAQLLKIIESI